MDSESFGEGGCLDSIIIFLKRYEVSEKDAQRQRQAVRTGSKNSDPFGEVECLDAIGIFLKQYEVSERDAERQRQVLVSSAVALGSRLDRVLSAVPVSFGRSGFSHAGGGHGWSPGRSCWRDWQSHRWWD